MKYQGMYRPNFLSKLNFKNVNISMRDSILIVFIILILMTTLVIVAVRSFAYKKVVTYTATSIMFNVSNTILNELNDKIKEIERLGHFTNQLLLWDILKQNQFNLMHYTIHLVRINPLIQGAYWSAMDGSLIDSRKKSNGDIVTEIIVKESSPPATKYYQAIHNHVVPVTNGAYEFFDPHERPWFQLVEKTNKASWTNVYPFFNHKKWGVTYATPVFDKQKKLLGIFAIDIALNFLTDFITKEQVSKHGFAFIIDGNDHLIAFPKTPYFLQLTDNASKLINLKKVSVPLINNSLDVYKKTNQREFEFVSQGESYLATYQPTINANEKWLVGVIAKKNDFTGNIERINLLSFLISLFFLLLGVILISIIVARIVKPLKILIIDTERIKHFELDEHVNISTHIKEVTLLHNALQSMKYGLKQFQKYVPKMLVQQLIEKGQETNVGGERKKLTIFFSDIENFTSIAENQEPDQLLLQLCEYFEIVSKIIIANDGTIDKYIGDSVMAFWGAPLVIKDPSLKAVQSAIACLKAIDQLNSKWQSQGKPCFYTRIGIHEGDAIVGNLGSSERLNYTALGDNINIASRLEGINKKYKTHLIFSEYVYHNIKEIYSCRLIDSVIVTGRTHPISIYTLADDMGENKKN